MERVKLQASQSSKSASRWSTQALSQDELVALKKEGIDGKVVTLQALPDLPLVMGNIDLSKAKWVSDGTRRFLSLVDFGGRGVVKSDEAVKIAGKAYRIDYRASINLEPINT
jgi:hypothetical protein